MRQQFGIYLPLFAINGLVFAASEEYYLRMPLRRSLFHALRLGGIVLLLFLATGIVRETLTFGTLFRDAGNILNSTGIRNLVHPGDASGLILTGKAPGAFICLGLVFALWNYMTNFKWINSSMNKQGQPPAIE